MIRKDEIKTRRLLLSPYNGDEDCGEMITKSAEALLPACEDDEYFELLTVKNKKTAQPVGLLRCAKIGEGVAEIDMQFYAQKDGEKIAAEALKGASRWFFRRKRSLLTLETWANPDMTAIRILEKAGFERVFESKGAVRYEKQRAHFPFLAVCMTLFTCAGILVGFLVDNYPLCVAIGIAAGILPGAVAQSIARKRRERKR